MDSTRAYRVRGRVCREAGSKSDVMKNPMHSHSSIQIGHRIYVLFGYFVNVGWNEAVWVLDTREMAWSLAPETAEWSPGLDVHTAAIVKDEIFVVGFRLNGEASTAEILCFDTILLSWTKCEMRAGSQPITFSSCLKSVYVEHRKELLILGTNSQAFSIVQDGHDAVRTLHVDSMIVSTPTVKGKPPEKLMPNFAVCSSESRVFVFGGGIVFGPSATASSELYILDVGRLTGLAWSLATAFKHPFGRWGCTLTHVRGRLLLLGGRNHNHVLEDFSVYDMSHMSWYSLPGYNEDDVPKRLMSYTGTLPLFLGHSAVSTNEKLFLLGGDRAGPMRDVFEIEPFG